MRRLDSIPIPGGAVKLIKSDAEGAEGLLFAGARALLTTHRPIVVAELNIPRLPVVSRMTADDFLERMKDLGYSCRLLEENGQLGKAILSASDSPDIAANVVFLPAGEAPAE